MRSKFKWIFTLLVAFTMQLTFAQEKTVKGTVSDATGPMPGVNVVVKGTQKGVSTGFDGTYAIKANVGDVLVFSFMGMNDITRTVDAAGVINVKMQEDAKQIETVVITALGVKRKNDQVIAAQTVIKTEELNRASAPNAVQALIGKVSGLQINTTNSSVAGENRVVLRAPRSITGNNQALVVIDGAISSLATFQQIPPDLIASVNVIKGAQGAALYGSDGVNGAIIVSTKKGAGDKFSVSIKSSVDISDVAYLPIRQLRYGQGWDGRHAIQENGSWGPEFDGTLFPTGLPQADGSFVVAPYSPIKNNLKAFFNKGTIIQNGITLSGGNLDSGYVNFSANRLTNDFILKGDALKRNSFLLKAGKKMGKFSVEGNINYITQSVTQAESGLYDELLEVASNIPIDAFEFSGNEGHWNTYNLNPYWERDNRRENSFDDKLALIGTLEYEFNKHFSLKYLANLRIDNIKELNYRNKYTDLTNPIYGGNNASVLANLFTSSDNNRRFYGDLLFTVNYDLAKDLNLTTIIGNNMQDNNRNLITNGGQNFAVPGVYNISNVLDPTPFGSTLEGRAIDNRRIESRKVGVFANVDLSYKDYLFINATARNDWSSVFKKSGNSFFYPSIGASFIPTKAFAGLSNNVLNYMKVAASYSRVGNDSSVAAYAINQLSGLGIGYPFNGINSYVQAIQPTDENITPEFVSTTDATVSFGFFGDRLTLDGSIYSQKTDDLITRQTVSGSTGFVSVLRNTGNLETKGFEIDLGFTPIKYGDRGLRWENKLNFTKYKSTVTKISDDSKTVSLRAPFNSINITADEGEEYPLIKGTTYTRDGLGRVIVDANGNPTIDTALKVLGKVNPDYILGLNSSLSYRGFKLSATMDYRTGHKFFSQTKRSLTFTGNTVESAENRSGFIFPNSSFDYNGDGAIQANEANVNVVTGGTGVPSIINYYNNFYTAAGENLILDATAFKVREASLGYTLSKDMIKNTGLSGLSFSINARNPINIFSKQNKNYADPEASETTGNAGGIAFTDRLPAQSTYGFSVNLTF
jgi:TonB-linked SusC/RagA family outer membrane protein